jgi:hypothetical protein
VGTRGTPSGKFCRNNSSNKRRLPKIRSKNKECNMKYFQIIFINNGNSTLGIPAGLGIMVF